MLKNCSERKRKTTALPHFLSFASRGLSNLQASMIYANCQNGISTPGNEQDKLEPIVSSLLTVMAEYACDDMSKVKSSFVQM